MTLSLLQPAWLLLLPLALLPLLPRRDAALKVSSLVPLQQLRPSWRTRLDRLRPLPPMLLIVLLLLALAGPQLSGSSRQTLRQGVDIMLVLDVSASMATADIPPSRLAAAKTALAGFLRDRPDDRVGVLLFAGVPYLLAAPTYDRQALLGLVETIAAEQRGTGTALGDALAAAVARLEHSPAVDRAVVLLTDGASNRGRLAPLTAAQSARQLGVRVYTIGFGAGDSGSGEDPLAEAELQAIAAATGGRYFRATDAAGLQAVYSQIDRLEKSPLETRIVTRRTPLEIPLLRWGALIAGLELLLFRGWLRRAP